jgi:hypothetical protein
VGVAEAGNQMIVGEGSGVSDGSGVGKGTGNISNPEQEVNRIVSAMNIATEHSLCEAGDCFPKARNDRNNREILMQVS